MTRAETAAAVQALRAQGFTHHAIAQRLGIPASTSRAYASDPDGTRQKRRRARYAGRCEICGADTDGSGGWKYAPSRCIKHNRGGEKLRGTGPVERGFLDLIAAGTTRFTDLRIALGISAPHASNILYRLVKYGLIERVARGQYRIRDAA